MEYPYIEGIVVAATKTVTEGGGDTDPNPQAKDLFDAGWIHARMGDIGIVEGVDDNTPTVRFMNSGTATIVGPDEIIFVANNSDDWNAQIEAWNDYQRHLQEKEENRFPRKAMMDGLWKLLTPEQQKELDKTGNITINTYSGRKIPMFPELDYAQMESRVAAAMLKDPCYGCKNMEGMLSGQSCEGCEHWPFAQAAHQHKKAAVALRFKPDYKFTKEQLEAAANEGFALMELVEKQVSDVALEAYAKFVEGEILRQRHAWKQRTFGMRYGRPPAWFRKQVKEGVLQDLFDMVPQTPTVTDPGDDPEEE